MLKGVWTMIEEENGDPLLSENAYLTQRLDEQIEWYNQKSLSNQRWYKRFKKTEMTLSALIPIIMVFWSDAFLAKLFIALAGGTVAVLSGIHGLYNFHENWIEYRSTSEILKHEKYMYVTHSGAYANISNRFQFLVERVESIISHENINWSQLNSSKSHSSTAVQR